MFPKVFFTECQKLRHSKLFGALLILPILAIVMGSFNFSQNLDMLSNSWYDLWTQVCLFYAYFFYPSLIGLYCAYMYHLEHSRNNWNAVFTAPISYTAIFISKLFVIACLSLITQLFIGLLYLLSGYFLGVEGNLPHQFYLWLLLGWISSLAVASLLLCIALIIRSFALPVGIGLVGGIGGLVILSKHIGIYFPFSLICVGMNALDPHIYLDATLITQIFFNSSCFIGLFSLIGIYLLKHLDY